MFGHIAMVLCVWGYVKIFISDTDRYGYGDTDRYGRVYSRSKKYPVDFLGPRYLYRGYWYTRSDFWSMEILVPRYFS